MNPEPTPSPAGGDDPLPVPVDHHARAHAEMAAAKVAMERLRAEMEAIAAERVEVDPVDQARRDATVAAVEAENPEWRENWEAMDEEERDEWMREFRRILHEHRGKLPDPASSPEAARLDAAITRMDESHALRERLGALKDELQGWGYLMAGNQAEVAGRMALATARMMRHWENAPAEEWDRLDPEGRGEMADLLARWQHGGGREEVLGQLPIEERRRFEAGE